MPDAAFTKISIFVDTTGKRVRITGTPEGQSNARQKTVAGSDDSRKFLDGILKRLNASYPAKASVTLAMDGDGISANQ